jgi:hypothetical protein
MKRYLVVAWYDYYPDGDLGNIQWDTDDQVEAKVVCKWLKSNTGYDHVQIQDRDRFKPYSSHCDRISAFLKKNSI